MALQLKGLSSPRSVSTLNTEARKSLNALAFFLSLLVRGSPISSITPVFSLDLFLLLAFLKKLLLSHTEVASINSSWDLAFLIFFLQTWLSYVQSAFLKIFFSPTDPSLRLSQSVSPGYRPRNIFFKTWVLSGFSRPRLEYSSIIILKFWS